MNLILSCAYFSDGLVQPPTSPPWAEEPAIGRAAKMSGMQFTPGPDEVLDMVEDSGFF